MTPLLYSLQFRGFATPIASGILEVRARAPAGALVTTIAADGLGGGFEHRESDEAVLESRLVLHDGTYDVTGCVVVGHGNMVRYRTLGRGRLSSCPDPHLRQGAVVCEVVRGEGQFARATGCITSSLLLSDCGDVTDTQLGVMFLAEGREAIGRVPGRRMGAASSHQPAKEEDS